MAELYPWQTADWQQLQQLSQRLPHGLLLTGAEGIGKLALAKAFAHSLLCQQPLANGHACGVCASCHWLSQDNHPDFRLLQPESQTSDEVESSESGKKASRQISVDAIRELADFIALSSHQGGLRVVIICPAEAMNGNAANALLKSLEEPPPRVVFMLLSHRPQQLLATINSRCLRINLQAPDLPNSLAWLQQQGIKQPAELLAAAGFSPLLAVNAAESLNLEQRQQLLTALSQPNKLDVFGLAESLQKVEQLQLVNWLQQWCYDLMACRMAGQIRYCSQQQAAIQKLAQQISPLQLIQWQKQLVQARREAQHTLNGKLFFEVLFSNYRQLMI